MERTWIEEKEVLQQEVDRLKSRVQVAEEQNGRDASVIATLEERLKESASPGSTEIEDVEGEDLNDEISTSRKDLYFQALRGGLMIDDGRLFAWKGSSRRLKRRLSSASYLRMAMARRINYANGSSSTNQSYLQPTERSQNVLATLTFLISSNSSTNQYRTVERSPMAIRPFNRPTNKDGRRQKQVS